MMKELQYIDHVTKCININRHKTIAIVGLPSCGKSTLAMLISNKFPGVYKTFATDSYIGTGRELQSLHDNLSYFPDEYKIIEGVLVYRALVSKVVVPDVIIECIASKASRFKRRGKDTPVFDDQLNRYWGEYLAQKNEVEIIQHLTSPI
jgi:nicotinamide riboside kinase